MVIIPSPYCSYGPANPTIKYHLKSLGRLILNLYSCWFAFFGELRGTKWHDPTIVGPLGSFRSVYVCIGRKVTYISHG